jgi:hypothetical protein
VAIVRLSARWSLEPIHEEEGRDSLLPGTHETGRGREDEREEDQDRRARHGPAGEPVERETGRAIVRASHRQRESCEEHQGHEQQDQQDPHGSESIQGLVLPKGRVGLN